MLKIALIDDKDYGIKHIKQLHEYEEIELIYFESFEEFKKSDKCFDIIYLDYYLDKDGITGDTILQYVKTRCNKLIGFSSVKRCNEELKKAGATHTVNKKHL